ncbi:MAG: hypothetical protein E6I93_07270 [Chloroflexi bacterium]|nr:MAG: hypothetical protein E6I93_07270 [Chloroflexota bacterium]
MGTRLTIAQLEQMKTHELAELLANVVLLLRRLPDIEYKQLVGQISSRQEIAQSKTEQAAMPTTFLSREELARRKVPELKALAKELNVLFSVSLKKEDLINKILARSADGRSEQRAIQDM